MARRVLFAWVAFALLQATPTWAQQATTEARPSAGFDRGTVISPVLTIDSERVFMESAFGRAALERIEAEGASLAAENRQIEAELEAEELALTEKRAQMSAEDFRALADTFDEKVQQTRRAQAEKGRAISAMLDAEREAFLTAAAPVLEGLMRDSGAGVILERRSVFVSANAIDITAEAIARLNETLDVSAPDNDR